MKLTDIIEIIGGGTPKTSCAEYWNGNIPWLSVKDFNNDNRYVYSSEKKITQSGLEHSSTKLLQKDDIIISARGTVGEIAMIPFPMAFNQSCYGIRGKNNVDNTFLYYFLKNIIHKLKVLTHGSVFDTITRNTFEQIEINLPELSTQKKIASVLSALDDKIELNNRINKNLEEQAQAIFKSWFVDFEPFGNVMPKDWKECNLEILCSTIIKGITPKYTDFSNEIVINQKCIRNHQIDLSLARCHSSKKINEKWLKYGDILINSTGTGTLGRMAQILFEPKNLTVDSHITIIRTLETKHQFYVGFWAMSQEKSFEELATGSTGQTDLPRKRLKQMKILLPNNEILIKFTNIIKPICDIKIKNQEENKRLSALRDVLIPKLINSEIKIP